MISCTAVVLAAGRGRRMDAGENKAFLEICGAPLVLHAVSAFDSHAAVTQIVLVVGSDEIAQAQALLRRASICADIVAGGEKRRDSAVAGVMAAKGELILIHDGARPFPSSRLIDRVIEGTQLHGACVPILPAIDTLRWISDEGFLQTQHLDRSRIASMQTPQGFRAELIRQTLPVSPPETPDDADAVLLAGKQVATVPGEATNLKITIPEDLLLAACIGSHLRVG